MGGSGRPNRTAIETVAGNRCPKCRHGRIFRSGAFDLSGFAKMHSECPACGQDFRVEPGFYVGASYLHYGFTAVVTSGGVLLDMALESRMPIAGLILTIIALNAILFPPTYRFSRSLMLHAFGSIRFDPHALNGHPRVFVGEDGVLREEESGEGIA